MPEVIDLRKKKAKKVETKTTQPKADQPGADKIEWVAPEFIKYKRGKTWFVLPALIALILAIIALLLKNFLFLILIALAALAVYIYALKEPKKIKFSISKKGIKIEKKIYKFEDLKSFWIFYEPPEIKELSLRSKKVFTLYIKIPLGDQNPVEIRKLLLKFLPERKHTESVVDAWVKKARF